MFTPWSLRTRKIWQHNNVVRGDFKQPPHRHFTPAVVSTCNIKLIKWKALRKHRLHDKTAASVLLKLFSRSNEWCHTTDPLAHERNSIFNWKQRICTLHDPWGPKNMTTQWCSTMQYNWKLLTGFYFTLLYTNVLLHKQQQ